MKYDIIEAQNSATLVGIINKLMGEGWKPHGSLIIDPIGIYCQAVIYEPPTQFLGPK